MKVRVRMPKAGRARDAKRRRDELLSILRRNLVCIVFRVWSKPRLKDQGIDQKLRIAKHKGDESRHDDESHQV